MTAATAARLPPPPLGFVAATAEAGLAAAATTAGAAASTGLVLSFVVEPVAPLAGVLAAAVVWPDGLGGVGTGAGVGSCVVCA